MPYESAHPSHIDWLAELPLDAVKRRLDNLIRHYARERSPTVAQFVVDYIEALCAHPECDGDASERCAYLRLRAHWRWLAEGASCPQVAA